MAFSSMYTGAAGVRAQSTLLQQLSANIANVNTTAYKSGNTFLETLASQSRAGSISGVVAGGGSNTPGQIGLGARVASSRINFKEGSFENTNNSTDIAIGGQGFFRVASADNSNYYTRAGNFHFNKNGELVDSQSNVLQGYRINSNGVVDSTSQNIVLPLKPEINSDGQEIMVVRSDPKASSRVSMRTNLDSGEIDGSQSDTNPFFALKESWNGKNDPPLDADAYAYHSAIQVYDDKGNTHDLVVYFDKVTNDGDPSDKIHWEYIVTIPPESDGGANAGTSAAGLLMTGTMTFTGEGNLINQSAFTLADGADPDDLNNWNLAEINSNGTPSFNAIFKDSDGNTSNQSLSLNMGITSASDKWNQEGTTAADIGSNASSLPGMDDWKIDAMATTAYNGSSSTISQSQDGFGEGYLQNVNFDSDGKLIAHFSNGLSSELYQVNLYNFKNEYGLRREGSNYFTETQESGDAIEGVANEDGLGSVSGNSLESSNVDLANEFANMILTQRGFQANSKTITTSDQLINTALGIKK